MNPSRLLMTSAIMAAVMVLAVAAPVRALDPARQMTQYSHQMWQEELPQNSVHTVLQTSSGYIWFGTYEGLVRFDGVRFVVFDAKSGGDLAGGTVNHLFEDSLQRLWISTDHGLTVYEGGGFRSYGYEDGFTNAFVNAVAEAADGVIWIASSEGLYRWQEGVISAEELPAEVRGHTVRSMTIAGDRLWLATDAGVVSLSAGLVRVYGPQHGLPVAVPRVVLSSRDGNILVGGDGGLFRGGDNGFTEVDLELGRTPAIRALYEDRAGVLWIGTEMRGLVRLAGAEVARLAADQGLSHNYVRSIAEDHEGSLWVGTNSGLNQLRDARVISYSTREGLNGEFARTVFEDSDGIVWIGTDGGGLNRFADGAFTSFTTNEGLANDSVRTIGQAPDGSLWVGTRGGVSRYADGRFQTLAGDQGLSSHLVRVVFLDRAGTMWVGTENGLNVWRGSSFDTLTTADGLAGNDVRALFEDSAGRLWVGTFDGVSCIDGDKITSYGIADGLSSNIVFAFFEDRLGELWIGTDNGLNLYNDGRISSFTMADNGLFDDKYFSILADNHGAVWTSSNSGLARITRAELRGLADGTVQQVHPTSYDASDGMRTSQCNGASQPAGWVASSGRLWFPTPHGVVEVDPADLLLNPYPPQVHVEEVMVDGLVVDPRAQALIAAGADRFEFHFTALSLAAPEWVRFRYQLLGYDEQPVEAGSRRAAYYTNLSPGTYELRVTACNDDGVWNDEGVGFDFQLEAAWWQTLWARFVLVLGVLAAVWLLVQLRLGSMEVRTGQLERKVEERTTELADKVRQLEVSERNAHISERRAVEASRSKSIFLSNMSHELRTPLNSIIGFASILKSRLSRIDDPRLVRFVTNIHGSGEHLLAIINDILDLSKIEAGRMEIYVDEFELQPLLEEVRRVMHGLSHRRGIAIDIEAPEEPIQMAADRSKIKQILFNLVSNAVKFSPGGGTVILRSSLSGGSSSPLSEPAVAIAVADNGPGIARRHQELIFEEFRQVDGSASREHEGTGLGLALVRRLLELQSGRIELQSELGKGSTFTVWIPVEVKSISTE